MPAITLALALACMGGGTAIKPDHKTFSSSESGSYDFGRGSYDGSFSGTVDGTRQQGFVDQVDVELNGADGRIRLPHVVVPIIHGGDGGWFDLHNLRVSDRAIDAEARINIINRPKVHIDRMTGVISINGKAGNYTGRCEAVQARAERRF